MPSRPGEVHREEGDVEAHEHQPERDSPEPVREQLAGQQRIPVVDARDDREQHAADQHVVQVGDDEIGVVRLPVERRERHHHAGQPADDEDRQRRRAPNSIGIDEMTRPASSVARKTKICTPVGIATASDAAEKKPSEICGRPVANMWWTHRPKRQEAGADGGEHDPGIADDRALREGRHDHRHQRDRRQEDDVDLRMAEDPEQVLPQQRVAAARRDRRTASRTAAPSRTGCRRRSAAGRRTGSSRATTSTYQA